MREIKFRAWDNLNLRMIQDYFYMDTDGQSWYDQDPHGVDMSGRKKIAPTNRLEVMQFTGLKDKNGKEIYEGDVVSVEDAIFDGFVDSGMPGSPNENMLPLVASVVFGDGYFHFDDEHSIPVGYYGSGLMEVIGNIYEHPSLIN